MLASTNARFDLERLVESVRAVGGDEVAALAERSYGGGQPVTPVAASREILDALPEGIGRLEVLAGAGHFAWKDAPDRHRSLLADFVLAAV